MQCNNKFVTESLQQKEDTALRMQYGQAFQPTCNMTANDGYEEIVKRKYFVYRTDSTLNQSKSA